MKNNLSEQIKQVEEKWLTILSGEVMQLFSKTSMPSHDFSHHLRVWYYAKELLTAFDEMKFSDDFLGSLMLAVFFHDTGLTITTSENHGLAGCSNFEKFADKYKLEKILLYEEIRLAIINHDNKEYTEINDPLTNPGIYHFLTVADDLDAFGALGLMRYFEIYCRRTIPGDQLVGRIKTNLQNRFQFVRNFIAMHPDVYARHEKRYQTGLSVLEELQIHEVEKLVELLSKNMFIKELAAFEVKEEHLRNFIELAASEESLCDSFTG